MKKSSMLSCIFCFISLAACRNDENSLRSIQPPNASDIQSDIQVRQGSDDNGHVALVGGKNYIAPIDNRTMTGSIGDRDLNSRRVTITWNNGNHTGQTGVTIKMVRKWFPDNIYNISLPANPDGTMPNSYSGPVSQHPDLYVFQVARTFDNPAVTTDLSAQFYIAAADSAPNLLKTKKIGSLVEVSFKDRSTWERKFRYMAADSASGPFVSIGEVSHPVVNQQGYIPDMLRFGNENKPRLVAKRFYRIDAVSASGYVMSSQVVAGP